MRHRIRSVSDLARLDPLLTARSGVQEAAACFPMAITPYYAALIRKPSLCDPVARMAIACHDELNQPAILSGDPLGEDAGMPVPGLIRRYQNRALVMITTTCAMYCRHCTRKRVSGQRESVLTLRELRRIATYLRQHPEIKDVIVSGGDPLTLPTERLEQSLMILRAVPSVEILRMGTRTPVTLPMRITPRLVAMLRRFHPLYVNTHFNHPVELTPEAARACRRLAQAGIPLGNQTVLLEGVNDEAKTLADLFQGLLRLRVRPYYLFQCDRARGLEHFRVPIARGIRLMETLRNQVSGLALPSYVVDTPGEGGKLPLTASAVVSLDGTGTRLRARDGHVFTDPAPVRSRSARRTPS